MQKYFSDAADMGKLYINYPMIESYQHLQSLPDKDYAERKILVSLKPGKEYKELVRKTVIAKAVMLQSRIEEILKKCGLSDGQKRESCSKEILDISDDTDIEDNIQRILADVIEEGRLQSAKYWIKDKVLEIGYVHKGQSYWEYMRSIFIQIICHNIKKANKIQDNQYQIETTKDKRYFEKLDMVKILERQNKSSEDADTGFIWVLNTCIFFVPEYNFTLIADGKAV